MVTSLIDIVSGDKLYVGTSTGNLHVYNVNQDTCWLASLLPIVNELTQHSRGWKASYGASGYKERSMSKSNRTISLCLRYILSRCSFRCEPCCIHLDHPLTCKVDTLVTLYPIPNFAPPTPLTKTKGALSFALYTYVEHQTLPQSPSLGEPQAVKPRTVPVVVSYLAVGCRRKIILYSWRDGEPQDVQVRLYVTHYVFCFMKQ